MQIIVSIVKKVDKGNNIKLKQTNECNIITNLNKKNIQIKIFQDVVVYHQIQLN